jgi:hypothetical protein
MAALLEACSPTVLLVVVSSSTTTDITTDYYSTTDCTGAHPPLAVAMHVYLVGPSVCCILLGLAVGLRPAVTDHCGR